MKNLISAIALLTPGAFAVAQDNPQEPRVRQYHYGDVIDVDKVISEDVTQIDNTQGIETVRLVYRDHAGVNHELDYNRIAENHQNN